MLEIERIQRQLSELEEWSARLAGEISLLNAVQIALEEGHATTQGLTPGLFGGGQSAAGLKRSEARKQFNERRRQYAKNQTERGRAGYDGGFQAH